MKLETPVVNVAESSGKYVEGPMIGDEVAEKLVSRLAGIRGPRPAEPRRGAISG